MAAIDPRDIASVAAKCLTSPGHESKTYELTGPEPLSCADQARILGAAITGLVRSGGAAFVSDAVKTVTDKPGRTFEEWCRDNAAAFR